MSVGVGGCRSMCEVVCVHVCVWVGGWIGGYVLMCWEMGTCAEVVTTLCICMYT